VRVDGWCERAADQASVLTTEPRDLALSSVGHVAVFSCQLDGTPTPRTLWYRDSDVIAADDDDDQQRYVVHDDNGLSVLEIHTVSEDDAGYFRCQAGNGVEQSVVSRFARLSFNTSSSPTNSCMYSCVGFVCCIPVIMNVN